ncbi:hypothetical protein LZ012_15365 [Dechloromonas sp. XY25]|uniref:CENP-V/GFA domain-containing protein n=1 Tax=Dechloromonas hankyongensis TaxID=2908002 RepID=A0ABS9K5D2_9RHOO|nr:hypothetical protein [Dechloromonas hankyongensis]MCG2578372.1 hypothetical protein [Dechloromonas hankyongensis]
MQILGRCRCGNISFTLDWTPDPVAIPARACSCSFCVAHSAAWTACSSGKLMVRIKRPTLVTRHSFATETAQFHICASCGDIPIVTSQIDGRVYAVVNTRMLQGSATALLHYESASFDGESVAARLERRRRHWIADVVIDEDSV